MAINLENITETYEALASGTSNAWEVYSGEPADVMAEENNIPAEKWLHDCAAMQAGQEIVAEELAKGIPQTAQERETRVRGVISRQISGLLRGQSDDAARKGVLLHALQAASDFQLDDDRVAELSRLDLDTLQSKVVDAAMKLTMNIALPVMEQKCQEAEGTTPNSEQQAVVWDNPGALAVAGYMEEPELREIPVAAGACAGIVSGCCMGGSSGDMDSISFGCLVVAAYVACFTLFVIPTGIVLASVPMAMVEGVTLAGVGAMIAENMALVSGFMFGMLALAAGLAVIGGLAYLLSQYTESESTSTSPEPTHIETGPIVST